MTTSKSNQFSLWIFCDQILSRRRSRHRRPELPAACSSLQKTSTRLVFAGAVRQDDGAADLLVGVTGVNAQLHMELDGLVKLGLGSLDDRARRPPAAHT